VLPNGHSQRVKTTTREYSAKVAGARVAPGRVASGRVGSYTRDGRIVSYRGKTVIGDASAPGGSIGNDDESPLPA
jgi:hypothetical protein